MKILIVDDVAFMLMSLRQLLERNGYEVVTKPSAKDALDVIGEDFSIDVVITDLMMPEMSGFDLHERVTKIQRFNDDGVIPPPPFIMLTAAEKVGNGSSWAAELKVARRTFAAVLQKPVKKNELLDVLEELQSNRSSEDVKCQEIITLLTQTIDDLRAATGESGENAIVHRLQSELQSVGATSDDADAE